MGRHYVSAARPSCAGRVSSSSSVLPRLNNHPGTNTLLTTGRGRHLSETKGDYCFAAGGVVLLVPVNRGQFAGMLPDAIMHRGPIM